MKNERITINNKALEYGVLNDGKSYQVYTYPGMTVAEMAFNIMVTIRLLEDGGYINNKEEFIALINKYYNDKQYLPIEHETDTTNSDTKSETAVDINDEVVDNGQN